MHHGYRGQILDVDLSARSFGLYGLSQKEVNRFVGGAGLNAWLLFNNTQPDTDPWSPENPLIFGAGPLVGTTYPTAARTSFTALSPLTGIFGDSNAGGYFGVAVKRAGYDHIIIRGRSESPCYLVIKGSRDCRIEDAADLWGKDTLETERALKRRYKGSFVATIGPAGENKVRYATIMTQGNANSFARAGMGAVMGAKKLKAIVVIGKGDIPVHAPKVLKSLSDKVKQDTKIKPFARMFRRYGTPQFIHLLQNKGLMYAENWRRQVRTDDILPIDIKSFFEAVDSKAHGCFRCPLKCGKHWKIRDGNYAGEEGYGYEVAFIISFGLTLGFRDVPSILHLVNKINCLGLDINEFAGTVGMTIDSRKNGILPKSVTGGIPLDWGDTENIGKLMEWTARRQGIGDILADGTRRAAEKIGRGAEEYALHMKGMHWPAHSAPPFVMAFSVSPRGGDFLKGVPHLLLQPPNKTIARQLFGATGKTMDIYSHEDKGRAVWWHENYKLLNDSLGICFYLTLTLLTEGRLVPEQLAEAYRAATGSTMDGKDLIIGAERSYQVERAINTLRGLNKSNDSFTRRPEPDSWACGIDLEKKGMLDEYYQYRGLSAKSGLPTASRLMDLGLEEVAVKLKRSNKLAPLAESSQIHSMESIVLNPTDDIRPKGLLNKLVKKMMDRKMNWMAQKPENLRKHFNNDKGVESGEETCK